MAINAHIFRNQAVGQNGRDAGLPYSFGIGTKVGVDRGHGSKGWHAFTRWRVSMYRILPEHAHASREHGTRHPVEQIVSPGTNPATRHIGTLLVREVLL